MSNPAYVAYLRRVRDAAQELHDFLHKTVTEDPETSPVILRAQGDDSDLYAAALAERLGALAAALRGEAAIPS